MPSWQVISPQNTRVQPFSKQASPAGLNPLRFAPSRMKAPALADPQIAPDPLPTGVQEVLALGQDRPLPLCLDLDGTLVHGQTLRHLLLRHGTPSQVAIQLLRAVLRHPFILRAAEKSLVEKHLSNSHGPFLNLEDPKTSPPANAAVYPKNHPSNADPDPEERLWDQTAQEGGYPGRSRRRVKSWKPNWPLFKLDWTRLVKGLDPWAARLPYRESLIHLAHLWPGPVHLVTGAPQPIAQAVARHLEWVYRGRFSERPSSKPLFSDVWATDGPDNLVSHGKASLVNRLFGSGAFYYVGDSWQDVPVWRHSAAIVTVTCPKGRLGQHLRHTTSPKIPLIYL